MPSPTFPAHRPGVLPRSALDGGSLVLVGGQNGTDADGEIVSDDLGEQTAQAFRSVLAVLSEAGCDQFHVARLSIYVQTGSDVTACYGGGPRRCGEAIRRRSRFCRWAGSPGPMPSALAVVPVGGPVGSTAHDGVRGVAGPSPLGVKIPQARLPAAPSSTQRRRPAFIRG
jgi:enamine deaminase RidA (YjgF/YER057c/UK114 family)